MCVLCRRVGVALLLLLTQRALGFLAVPLRSPHAQPLLGRVPHAQPLLSRPPRRAAVVLLEDEELSQAFRQLGILEGSTYDEIMDAYMDLSETYSEDAARLASLESAKEKILDDRLRTPPALAAQLRNPWRTPPPPAASRTHCHRHCTPLHSQASAWRAPRPATRAGWPSRTGRRLRSSRRG